MENNLNLQISFSKDVNFVQLEVNENSVHYSRDITTY